MNTTKDYKRQTREVSPDTRQKISQALRGRNKSATHKDNISKGLTNYWKQIPPKDARGPVINTIV